MRSRIGFTCIVECTFSSTERIFTRLRTLLGNKLLIENEIKPLGHRVLHCTVVPAYWI